MHPVEQALLAYLMLIVSLCEVMKERGSEGGRERERGNGGERKRVRSLFTPNHQACHFPTLSDWTPYPGVGRESNETLVCLLRLGGGVHQLSIAQCLLMLSAPSVTFIGIVLVYTYNINLVLFMGQETMLQLHCKDSVSFHLVLVPTSIKHT